MRKRLRNTSKNYFGFTLVELMVTVGIISVLASIVFVNYSSARAKARDERRISDLQQIQVALEQYRVVYGEFPCETPDSGAIPPQCPTQSANANGEIGSGGLIDTLIGPYMKTVPHDSKGPGNATYSYEYDGSHDCSSAGPSALVAVIYATELESDVNKNWDDACGGPDSGPDADTYIIIIGPSSG